MLWQKFTEIQNFNRLPQLKYLFCNSTKIHFPEIRYSLQKLQL
jgi:hypothetical protein